MYTCTSGTHWFKQRNSLFWVPRGLAHVSSALVCAHLIACAAPGQTEVDEEDPVAVVSSPLTASAAGPAATTAGATLGSQAFPRWTFCAREHGFCSFSGRRRVRFAIGAHLVRAFENGVRCERSNFTSWPLKFDQPPVCLVSSEVLPVLVGSSASQVQTSTRVHGTAGASNTTAQVSNTSFIPTFVAPATQTAMPAMTGAAGMTGMAGVTTPVAPTPRSNPSMSGMTMMPFVNRAAIPTGDPGIADPRIKNTTEQPEPGDGTGAFRTSCNFSHMTFDDPIVFPGMPGASHLHAYFGNSLTNAASTAESIRGTGNSTCRGGTANRTAYWVPALVDGAGNPQRPLQAQIYYKTGYLGVPAKDVVAFPVGLRMIAGDSKAKGPQEWAYWRCDGDFTGHSDGLPQCAGKQIVMVVEFPQCWDGLHLDSADHKSHMAYADGGCPKSHPIPTPVITFNIPYQVPPAGTAGWRLASDNYDAALPGGFSAHGDWFDGWDHNVVAEWIKFCDNAAVDCHSHLLGDGRAIFFED